MSLTKKPAWYKGDLISKILEAKKFPGFCEDFEWVKYNQRFYPKSIPDIKASYNHNAHSCNHPICDQIHIPLIKCDKCGTKILEFDPKDITCDLEHYPYVECKKCNKTLTHCAICGEVGNFNPNEICRICSAGGYVEKCKTCGKSGIYKPDEECWTCLELKERTQEINKLGFATRCYLCSKSGQFQLYEKCKTCILYTKYQPPIPVDKQNI